VARKADSKSHQSTQNFWLTRILAIKRAGLEDSHNSSDLSLCNTDSHENNSIFFFKNLILDHLKTFR